MSEAIEHQSRAVSPESSRLAWAPAMKDHATDASVREPRVQPYRNNSPTPGTAKDRPARAGSARRIAPASGESSSAKGERKRFFPENRARITCMAVHSPRFAATRRQDNRHIRQALAVVAVLSCTADVVCDAQYLLGICRQRVSVSAGLLRIGVRNNGIRLTTGRLRRCCGEQSKGNTN